MYITIEGPVGAGKTSLTNILSEQLNADTLYEIVDENPFLGKYYEDRDKWAFQNQMFFLTSRYTQIYSMKDELENGKNVVADYNVLKNLVFAIKSLNEDQYNTFKEIYDILVEDLPKADLIIFLVVDFTTMKKRIQMRNRSFEQDTENEYWEYLIDAYAKVVEYLKEENKSNYLLIEATNYDFVNSDEDRQEVLNIINEKINELKEENE